MLNLCWLPLGLIVLCACVLPAAADSDLSDIQLLKRHPERRTAGGIHIPLLRRQASKKLSRRDGQTGAIGLGDYADVTYTILVKIGNTETPLVLDTGSSDLWVVSDACTGNCSSTVPLYPQASFQGTGLDAKLMYGDSSTGTHAYGPIGQDTVGLAGINLQGQYFAAINNTNTSVLLAGSAGIFGLGFPINSVVWMEVFSKQSSSTPSATKREIPVYTPIRRTFSQSVQNLAIRFFPKTNFNRPKFPSLISLNTISHTRRQSQFLLPTILSSYASIGPFLSRLVALSQLSAPQVTITLQRDSVSIGGNLGEMSLGELPAGVTNDTLTWVGLRRYSPQDGGLSPPVDSPGEVYPIAWEVAMDDVYFDGKKLPRSGLSDSGISLSALVDTGNSLIRGPSDVIKQITSTLGPNGNFPCSEPHTLAFQIGGKMFPVDPRDFTTQVYEDSLVSCSPNLAATDPPAQGSGYLYSWSLGDPFLKSVLASFYYGNLSYPSHDPPRLGFLSTVPSSANDDLKSAVAKASANGGNFPATSDTAPTGTAKSGGTGSGGVAQASSTGTSGSGKSGAYPHSRNLNMWTLGSSLCMVCISGLLLQ